MSQLEQSLLHDPDALENDFEFSKGKKQELQKKSSRKNSADGQNAKNFTGTNGKRVKTSLFSKADGEMTKEEAGKRTLEFLENEVAIDRSLDPNEGESKGNTPSDVVSDKQHLADSGHTYHGRLPKYTEDVLPSSSRQDFVSKEGGGDSVVEGVAKMKSGKRGVQDPTVVREQVGKSDGEILTKSEEVGTTSQQIGVDTTRLKKMGSLERVSDEDIRRYIRHANSEEGNGFVEDVARKGEERAEREKHLSAENSVGEWNEAGGEGIEGEYIPAGRLSIGEAREEMEKAGKVYADLRGREDKIRNRLPKFLLSLVGKGEKTDATKQERIWRGTVSEYQQLRLEEIKQTAKSEKWSSDRLKKEMAELVRETDVRARLSAISHYDNAKWGESGETWKTRLLGRSKKFAEEYRTFCKEHKVAAFALRGGLLLGSGALGGAALALPMGVLMRALGSYGAARALKEFFDRRANEKLVAEVEQSETLKSVEKMVVTPENLAKFQEQLRKTDVVEQFEGFRKGAKRRAKWALFVGGGLFLGGMALSHFAHAAQDVAEAKGAVSVSGAVDGVNHDAVGSHTGTVESPLPTPSAVSEIPVDVPSAAETVVSGVTESAIHHASLEAVPLVVRAGSSIEGTIIEHLTGTGMPKEEAGKVAHRMALAYAREHHIPFKELGVVQPNTNLSIVANPNNVKTPFQISGDITFGPKVSETPVLESQSFPKSNVVSLDDHRVKVTPPVVENVPKPVIGTVPDELLKGKTPMNAGEILKASQETIASISADFQHQLGMLNMPNVENAARADISNLFTQEKDVKQMSGEVFKLLFPGQQLIRTETALSLLRRGTFHGDSMVRMSQISAALRQLCGYKGSIADWLFQQNETLGEWLNRISENIMKSPEYQSHVSSALKKAA